MKKALKKTMALTLTAVAACLTVACGGTTPQGEEIDANKTQIYVYNFNKGYGSAWLTNVKTSYETEMANYEGTDGKKGVQVVIYNKESNDHKANTVNSDRHEVYFTEYANYHKWVEDGMFADITSVLTEVNPYDGKTIISKYSQNQEGFYNCGSKTSPVYYGIPHYAAYNGIIYNANLFEEKGFFLSKNPVGDAETNLAGQFTSDASKKTAGPDGIAGNEDDGLPRTYEEFYMLCEYIGKTDGIIPLTMTADNKDTYVQKFALQLMADADGAYETFLNYSLDGTASTLGSVNGDGTFSVGASLSVNASNGVELKKQAGKYYALQFLETLIDEGYINHNAINKEKGYSHKNAQKDFVMNGKNGYAQTAMLIDGCWWEMEANQALIDAGNPEADGFKMMPLPKPTKALQAARARAYSATETSGEYQNKGTLIDEIGSLCFVKKSVDMTSKQGLLIKDFLQYVYSDSQLVEFTKTTSTTRALKYDVADTTGLSTYAKSLLKAQNEYDVVYPLAASEDFKNHWSDYSVNESFRSQVGSESYQYIVAALKKGVSAKEYFEGMYTYYSAK